MDSKTPKRYDPWHFFKLGVTALFVVAVASTLVYYLLGIYYGAHWGMWQCLFMVVITLSTIGYGDWLHIEGKRLVEIYTMFLALVGVGVPAFIISNLTALIVGGILSDTVRRRRMQQEINKISGHIVVCGAGTTGEHCIDELCKLGYKVVAIDRNEERLKMLQPICGPFLYVVGEADRDEVLVQAGVARAEGLIACLTDDKDNLFITLSARLLNPKLRIASKGIDDHARRKMAIAGANAVVNPTAMGGLRLVSELVQPATMSFLDTMLRERNAVRFAELVVGRESALAGRTLAAADLRRTADVLIVAARPPGAESFVYNPKADFPLQPGCVVVMLGLVSEINKLRPLFGGTAA